ncbi:MAG: chemotaxis response regulator protein-glutamate methylesterase [Clostridiaceae bacterium]|nr:chemotaxis response regulator protein-glutamate methylesterase [Clostridiaceae bacterium]
MIKVLIVDDSSFIRVRIRTLLETSDKIKVIGIARNGMDAVHKTIILKPDVITMDINMPDISGIEAVELIMKQRPTPIIMVSSLTYDGAYETLEALEKGAVDYIHKDNLSEEILIEKILIANEAKISIDGGSAKETKKSRESGKPHSTRYADFTKKPSISFIHHEKKELPDDFFEPQYNANLIAKPRDFSIIGIGISTGGPKALATVLPRISADIPASIVIAQHMPSTFTKPLAERLDRISQLRVKEAEDGEQLLPGHAYICPGGKHIMIEKKDIVTLYDKKSFANLHYCPSASLLMSSIAKVYGDKAMCVIMTGMGSDGLEGITEAKEKGSYVIAQSESSSVIFGMPKAVIINNLHDEIVHLDNIADRINKLCLKE